MTATFAVRLTDNNEKLAEDFRRFLEGQGLDTNEVSRIVSEFDASAIPQIGRFRALTNSGSNVNFSRDFNTSVGPVTVTLDTSQKSLFSRIGGLFRR